MITAYLLEVALKATLLLALTFATVLLVKGPANRHFVWKLCLAAILALPILSALPGCHILLFPTATALHQPAAHATNSSTQNLNDTGAPTTQAKDDAPQPTQNPSAILVAVWGLGFLVCLSRIGYGLLQLRTIKSTPAQLENPQAQIRLETNDQGLSPLTWGHFRPVILLPNEALSWPANRLECVLLHEQAHIQRHDFLFKLLTEAACAIYWFNPLMWLAARSMNAEAEMAADALAAQTREKPSDYATELLWLASHFTKRPAAQLASGVPAMNKTKLEQRIQSVLDPTRARGMTTFAALAPVAILGVVTTGLATMHSYATGKAGQDENRKIADGRAKTLAVASQMYSLDYDGNLPYATDTDTAEYAIWPYVMDLKTFESPTPGGHFVYNSKVGAVNMKSFKDPANEVIWYESLPDQDASFYAANADGRARLITRDKRDRFRRALRQRHRRDRGAVPLPHHAPPVGK